MRHSQDSKAAIRDNPPDPRRFHAARVYLGYTGGKLEELTGACYRHLLFWLRDGRPISAALRDRVQAAFGPTWSFVIGETNELKDSRKRAA
jgi:hypothetical protein